MAVRASYCRWYVSGDSPRGMFLVCVCVLYSGTNHMGDPQ